MWPVGSDRETEHRMSDPASCLHNNPAGESDGPHFADEKVEDPRGNVTCLGSRGSEESVLGGAHRVA